MGQEVLDFPVRCAQWVINHAPAHYGSVLDLGCAVGRSSFELSKIFDEVVGIDYSASFIRAANILKTKGRLKYSRVDEGEIQTELEARLEDGVNPQRVWLYQGDACNLPKRLGKFDAVLMANLICRLTKPKVCLKRSADLVKAGGVLILTTPCTWMEEYTPKSRWLGGLVRKGKVIKTLDGITEILEPAFRLEKVAEEPFLIREHARKYQVTSAQVSVWRRT